MAAAPAWAALSTRIGSLQELLPGGGPSHDLGVDRALHQARIIVDEEGTEAAAATAVITTPLSGLMGEPPPVTIDTPFVFYIRDIESNATLFVGQFVGPE